MKVVYFCLKISVKFVLYRNFFLLYDFLSLEYLRLAGPSTVFASAGHSSFDREKTVNEFPLGLWICFWDYGWLLSWPRWKFLPWKYCNQVALQSFFQKVAEIKNKKNFSLKNLLLPLTSGVEIFLGCTIFEFGFFCLQKLLHIWYEKQKMLQNEF